MLELKSFRGSLAFCGPELADHIQRLSPKSQVDFPHITVLAKHEVQKLGTQIGSAQSREVSQKS